MFYADFDESDSSIQKKKWTKKKWFTKHFVFNFFSLGFSLEFAKVDSINKVGFVNIILCIKCPIRVEYVSVFFSEVDEWDSSKKKIRHPLKIKGITIGNSVAILTKTIVRKKK